MRFPKARWIVVGVAVLLAPVVGYGIGALMDTSATESPRMATPSVVTSVLPPAQTEQEKLQAYLAEGNNQLIYNCPTNDAAQRVADLVFCHRYTATIEMRGVSKNTPPILFPIADTAGKVMIGLKSEHLRDCAYREDGVYRCYDGWKITITLDPSLRVFVQSIDGGAGWKGPKVIAFDPEIYVYTGISAIELHAVSTDITKRGSAINWH